MTDSLLSSYLDWLRLCRRSRRTVTLRTRVLGRMDAELPHGLAAANADELKAWIFRPGWSKATLSTYYGSAAAFFSYATGPACPHPLDFNPMALLPRPSVPRGLPRPVSDSELEQILTRAADPFQLWAVLAAYQGLRCCEIATLNREHVTEEDLKVVAGKGDKPAILPTHPEVWKAVRRLPPGPVAHTKGGLPATAQYVSIHSALHFRETLGIKATMHQLRHWYGTTIYRKTQDLRRTQEMLRHASPTTTAIYTLISSEERRAAIQTLPTFTGS